MTIIGDVFEDCDPRMAGRRIRVVAVKDGQAFCKHISGNGPMSRIRLDRLRPIGNKKGFRRVDALCSPPAGAPTDGAA